MNRLRGMTKERGKRIVEGWRWADRRPSFLLWAVSQSALSPSPTLMHRDGIRFTLRHRDWNAFREIFVEDEYGIVRELLGEEPHPVVVDLGANVGLFSLLVFMNFPEARLIAVEPSSHTFEVLATNRALNPSTDWTCRRAAVDERDGTVRFHNDPTSTASRVAADGDEEVEAVTMSSLVGATAGPIDLVKLDVEGAEARALRGGREVLSRVKNLIVEVHPAVDLGEVMQELSGGFEHVYKLRRPGSSKPLLLGTRVPSSSDLLEPLS